MEVKPTFEKAWEIAQRFYYSQAGKWCRHPYVLDLMWDASVDALLNAWNKWRPEVGAPFVEYLFLLTKNGWRGANVHELRLKRDIRRTWLGEKKLARLKAKDTGQDCVDGKELWDRAKGMNIPGKEVNLQILYRYYSGELIEDIAESRGVSRQAIEQRIGRTFGIMKDALLARERLRCQIHGQCFLASGTGDEGEQIRIKHANRVKVYDNSDIVEGTEVKETEFGRGNSYFDKLPRDWAITQQRMRGYLCRELRDEFGITHQAISLQEIAFLNTARGWFRGSQLDGTLTHA